MQTREASRSEHIHTAFSIPVIYLTVIQQLILHELISSLKFCLGFASVHDAQLKKSLLSKIYLKYVKYITSICRKSQ